MHILKKDMKSQNLLLQAQDRTLINTTFKSGSQSYKFSFASLKDVFKPLKWKMCELPSIAN